MAVLSGVTVTRGAAADETFAVSGRRQLVLGVSEAEDAARFFRLVGALDDPGPHRRPAGLRRGRRPGRRGRCRVGVDGAGLLGERAGIVVLKRCVDVDDLLAAASAGQATWRSLGVDAPGLDQAAVEHLRSHAVRPVAIVPGGAALDAARLRATRIGIRSTGRRGRARDAAGRGPGRRGPRRHGVRGAEPDDARAASAGARGRAGRGGVGARGGARGAPRSPWVWRAELARRGLPHDLVDADPYGGAVAQQLGILDEVSGLLRRPG